MSEARAITNLIGNGVATLVISRSENAFDDTMRESAVAELAEARRTGHAE
jgi:aerobic C4-dicarboxylate transport protein